jgi:hypothetical protein
MPRRRQAKVLDETKPDIIVNREARSDPLRQKESKERREEDGAS